MTVSCALRQQFHLESKPDSEMIDLGEGKTAGNRSPRVLCSVVELISDGYVVLTLPFQSHRSLTTVDHHGVRPRDDHLLRFSPVSRVAGQAHAVFPPPQLEHEQEEKPFGVCETLSLQKDKFPYSILVEDTVVVPA